MEGLLDLPLERFLRKCLTYIYNFETASYNTLIRILTELKTFKSVLPLILFRGISLQKVAA